MSGLTDRVPYCIIKAGCLGPSFLVGTCYGFTGGDKWRCQSCEGYCVVRPNVVPDRIYPDSQSSR